jgi:para-nitrobenzyl esterase
MLRACLLLGLLLGCASASPESDRKSATDVITETGVVRGESVEGVRSWLGIPYAAPPIGANRFRAPQPPAKWSTPRDAKTFGAACPQVNTMTGSYRAGEEDCLTLNVWSPDPAPAQPLPVMVWIHGGAFLLGSSAQDLYNGAALARQQRVVVVSMNYRLGPLGYLAHSALGKEDPANGTGNYGLLDQRAALRWVRTNIRAFGGDDKNITVFGESAGGMSVASHLVSPGSAGLFERAIVQSGTLALGVNLYTVPEAERQAIALGKALGCGEPLIECLRSKPFENVVDALKNPTTGPGGIFQGVLSTAMWLPVVDGVFMPKQLSELYAAGAIAARVPTMLGSNLNEGTLFHSGLLGDRPITDTAAFEASLTKLLGDENGKKALMLYPLEGKQPNEVIAQAESDALFACPTRRAARALVKAGVATFRYHFVRKPDNGIAAAFGATHGADIPFMFGNDDSTLGGVSDAGMPLREAMMRYWSRFAATGDPNGAPDLTWPRYDAASDPFLTLDTPLRAGTQLLADKCAFWDSVPAIALPKTFAD